MKISPQKKPPGAALINSRTELEHRFGALDYRPIETLKTYANNPRKHSEKQITMLMASMTEFGFAIPVLVDAESVIIAGEARVTAARRLGVSHVPVLVAEHWSAAQVRAYRLTDNRLALESTWSEDLLRIEIASVIELGEVSVEILGWNTAEIDILLDDTASEPDDRVPELPNNPISRPGDLWRLGSHRLLCGSSLELANWRRLMEGKVGSMSFSDGPFNVPIMGHVSGLGKHSHPEFQMASSEMSAAEFTKFNVDFLTNVGASSKDGAIIMACIDWRHLSEMLSAIKEAGLALINLCVWNKTNAGMGSLYRSKHELVLICKKGSAPHTNNVMLGKHGRARTNVWDYAGANAFGARRDEDLAAHPTVKPTALVADAIKDVSARGEIVLDAFMGSGTTILAAEQTGRVAYGIEIAPQYIDVAIQRWSERTGGIAILDETGEALADVAMRRSADLELCAAA